MFFEHFTDDEGILPGLFLSDATSKSYGKAFGDVVSFDATYRTNKYELSLVLYINLIQSIYLTQFSMCFGSLFRYRMVFFPFTAIDNHQKFVTVGAGLISKETEESYIWLLNCFKRSIQRDPILLVTDEDKSMNAAITKIFSKYSPLLAYYKKN